MQIQTYRKRLDMQKSGIQWSVNAKIGDAGSRRIVFTVTDGGNPFYISDDLNVTICAVKPDETVLYNACTVSDGKAVYDITNQTLAAEGTVECELRIEDNGQIITSPKFNIEVESVIDNDNAIVSSNEFTALIEATQEAIEATENANTATEEATEATENANTAATTATKAAENANTAATTATEAAESATEAAEDATEAATKARIYGSNASTLGDYAYQAANRAYAAAAKANEAAASFPDASEYNDGSMLIVTAGVWDIFNIIEFENVKEVFVAIKTIEESGELSDSELLTVDETSTATEDDLIAIIDIIEAANVLTEDELISA